MLYLQDLLPDGKEVKVEYRCNAPKCWQDEEEDILFGFAIWNGKELISGDGDNYYLKDVVERYKWENENYLTIWIGVGWNSDRKESS
jgi:outer membrane protease